MVDMYLISFAGERERKCLYTLIEQIWHRINIDWYQATRLFLLEFVDQSPTKIRKHFILSLSYWLCQRTIEYTDCIPRRGVRMPPSPQNVCASWERHWTVFDGETQVQKIWGVLSTPSLQFASKSTVSIPTIGWRSLCIVVVNVVCCDIKVS